jgi:hypothetical protein
MRRCVLPACAMALHEADAAALPCGVQHAIGRGLEAFVCIRDHQLDTTQAASRQAAQEVVPEGLGLAGIDRHAEHFTAAVAVHADGDDDRHRYHRRCVSPCR